jgi:hypothetical protein
MIAVSVATMLRIDEFLHRQHDDIDLEAGSSPCSAGARGRPRAARSATRAASWPAAGRTYPSMS